MINYYTLEYYTHKYIKLQYLSAYFIVAQWSAILLIRFLENFIKFYPYNSCVIRNQRQKVWRRPDSGSPKSIALREFKSLSSVERGVLDRLVSILCPFQGKKYEKISKQTKLNEKTKFRVFKH